MSAPEIVTGGIDVIAPQSVEDRDRAYGSSGHILQFVPVGDPNGHVRRRWRRPDGTFLTRLEGEQYLRLISGGKKPSFSRLRRLADALRVLATLGSPSDDR